MFKYALYTLRASCALAFLYVYCLGDIFIVFHYTERILNFGSLIYYTYLSAIFLACVFFAEKLLIMLLIFSIPALLLNGLFGNSAKDLLDFSLYYGKAILFCASFITFFLVLARLGPVQRTEAEIIRERERERTRKIENERKERDDAFRYSQSSFGQKNKQSPEEKMWNDALRAEALSKAESSRSSW